MGLGWHTKTPKSHEHLDICIDIAKSQSPKRDRGTPISSRQRHGWTIPSPHHARLRVWLVATEMGKIDRPRHQVDFVCRTSKTRPRLSGLTRPFADAVSRARQPFAKPPEGCWLGVRLEDRVAGPLLTPFLTPAVGPMSAEKSNIELREQCKPPACVATRQVGDRYVVRVTSLDTASGTPPATTTKKVTRPSQPGPDAPPGAL